MLKPAETSKIKISETGVLGMRKKLEPRNAVVQSRIQCHCTSIKARHTFTSIMFEQRRFGLGCPGLHEFDLIKAVATQTEASLFKQRDAGERVDPGFA